MRTFQAYVDHGVAELLAILGLGDNVLVGADHLDIKSFQGPGPGQFHCHIQSRLPAHGRQQGIGFFVFDDPFKNLGLDRLDVSGVGQTGIGHDGGRVGIDQDHPVAFFFKRLAGLGAGIVELAGLADNDGPGADDEDRGDIGALWHGGPTSLDEATTPPSFR